MEYLIFREEAPEQIENASEQIYKYACERTTPPNEELLAFESDLYGLGCSIKLDIRVSEFQKQLKTDLIGTRNSDTLLIPVD